MSKTYPLELEFSYGLDVARTLACFSRGHHPAAEFLAAYIADHPRHGRGDTLRPLTVCDVRHLWQRNVPGRDGWTQYVECHSPGAGAYPVTIIDFQRVNSAFHAFRNELTRLGCPWEDATARTRKAFDFLNSEFQ